MKFSCGCWINVKKMKRVYACRKHKGYRWLR